MSKIGKIGRDVFENFVAGRLGKSDDKILVPPKTGIDAGVLDIGGGKVLIVAEDPIFPAPKQPLDTFGWYTVHIGASDVAVMGVAPQYMTYTLLMPPGTSDGDFRMIIDSIHETALELGIAILGGHTGYYPGLATPIVGGVSVFSVVDSGSYVTPAGAGPGDDIILTKGPAIEATALLSQVYEDKLKKVHPAKLVDSAIGLWRQMSVVKDSAIAMREGGVTAMHDATEGGVIGGLFEIAHASCVGMEVDESLFIHPPEVEAVCGTLGIDPIEAIAEGSLLITAKPGYARHIIAGLRDEGIEASVIGSVTRDVETRFVKRRDGSVRELEIPAQDPFWPAFFKGLEG